MMDFSETALITFFTQFAYYPLKAYGLVIFFMLACAVILPFPEEVILLIAGLMAHMARHPDLFPPAQAGAEGVDTFTMVAVCYVAVLLSDVLVYFMGRFFGDRIMKTKIFQARFAGERFDKINTWFQEYGGLASGIFRFTPGFRFPGHLTCGFLGISIWKFIVIDAVAAMLFVVPQVLIYAFYGDIFLKNIEEVKGYVFYGILILAGLWLFRKFVWKKKSIST